MDDENGFKRMSSHELLSVATLALSELGDRFDRSTDAASVASLTSAVARVLAGCDVLTVDSQATLALGIYQLMEELRDNLEHAAERRERRE